MAPESAAAAPVLVVDDDADLRALVSGVLNAAGYATLEAGNGSDALELAPRSRPQLAVRGVDMPGVSGYELCRRLKEEVDGSLAVIFLSGVRAESYDKVVGLSLGADDYISKPFAPDELVARVRTVLRRAHTSVPARAARLTRREHEVLRLLADGRSQKQIAQDLVISPKTVGTHIEHILEKLDVRSRSQAIALAYREDLLASA